MQICEQPDGVLHVGDRGALHYRAGDDSNLLPIFLCAHTVLGFDFFFLLVCRHWWFSGSGAAEVSSSEMQWILISYYVVV